MSGDRRPGRRLGAQEVRGRSGAGDVGAGEENGEREDAPPGPSGERAGRPEGDETTRRLLRQQYRELIISVQRKLLPRNGRGGGGGGGGGAKAAMLSEDGGGGGDDDGHAAQALLPPFCLETLLPPISPSGVAEMSSGKFLYWCLTTGL